MDFQNMMQAAPPAWLGAEENIAKQRTASVVFSFTKIDEKAIQRPVHHLHSRNAMPHCII
jgi:hypothetical protein